MMRGSTIYDSKQLSMSLSLSLVSCLVLCTSTPVNAQIADAAMRDDVTKVKSLLLDGGEVNAAHGDGMTALHWVAENGNHEIARILLESGADTEVVTRLGAYRPLHLAARQGHPPILLLDEVIAHLDEARRQALFEELLAMRAQAWLSGTDPTSFASLRGHAHFMSVAENRVSSA